MTVEGLAGALRRANGAFHDPLAWQGLQRNGMSTDVSWRDRASRYATLYRDAVAGRRER